MNKTDEQLAELCRKQDHQAFQELMNRYLRPIFNFNRQYARAIEDVDDITQDTFFKVWKYIGKFKQGMTFRPWLYTIARNTALDHIKKKKAVSFSELDDNENNLSFAETIEDIEPSQIEILENDILSKNLSGKLESLHPDYQAVITLRYNEEMTFEEIAVVVNRPMNTVKSWHRRALIQLQKLMKDHLHQKH
ncbi:MAG: RNA polymerase sigma factor [Candidatus Paceibacterota bacterium]